VTGASEWLFPGNSSTTKPMSNNTILQALKRIGYQGQMTGHGFRGLASAVGSTSTVKRIWVNAAQF
jgi:hypothetical protein